MPKIKTITTALCMFSAILLLASCASTSLAPGVAKVQISPNPPAKNCRFIASLTGNQGGFFSGGFTSNKNLQQGAFNDLRNQAAAKGANYVQTLMSHAGSSEYKGTSQVTSVTATGSAYYCP